MEQLLYNLWLMKNKNNPEVIKYRKLRDLLQEVATDIFQKEVDFNYEKNMASLSEKIIDVCKKQKVIKNYELGFFDEDDQQFLIKILIYNYAYGGVSAAKSYRERCRYRRQDKIEMLNIMCDNKCGIFKIISFNEETMMIKLLNLVTNEEVIVMDESCTFFLKISKDVNKNFFARILKTKEYYIFDGFIELEASQKLVQYCKNKEVSDVEMSVLAKLLKKQ